MIFSNNKILVGNFFVGNARRLQRSGHCTATGQCGRAVGVGRARAVRAIMRGSCLCVCLCAGRSAVTADPKGEDFPWKPKPFHELIGDAFVGQGKAPLDQSAVEGKVLGLYFSAHWCPPCRGFTPKLAEWYKAVKETLPDFEIVFASSDRDEVFVPDALSLPLSLSLSLSLSPPPHALSSYLPPSLTSSLPPFLSPSLSPSFSVSLFPHKAHTTSGHAHLKWHPPGKAVPNPAEGSTVSLHCTVGK